MSGLPVQGSPSSRVAIVEFSDYECPYCARHAKSVFIEVKEQFVETGKVRYLFANNPLKIHQNAEVLAAAAICAGQQDHYWSMHDALFELMPRSIAEILALASRLNLNEARLQQCIDNDPAPRVRIEQDMQNAQALSLGSTPAFAIGHVISDRIKIAKLIIGAQPLVGGCPISC
jgi:protein-disulfide isomerase